MGMSYVFPSFSIRLSAMLGKKTDTITCNFMVKHKN